MAEPAPATIGFLLVVNTSGVHLRRIAPHRWAWCGPGIRFATSRVERLIARGFVDRPLSRSSMLVLTDKGYAAFERYTDRELDELLADALWEAA